jgi:hypothetical protein
MISQKLEIIRRLEGGESQSVVIAACNIGFATTYDMKQQKDQWWLFMASNKIVKGLFKWETRKSIK